MFFLVVADAMSVILDWMFNHCEPASTVQRLEYAILGAFSEPYEDMEKTHMEH